MDDYDMFVWPDGFWCFRHEFNPGFMRGLNFQEITHQSDEWHALEKRGLINNIRSLL